MEKYINAVILDSEIKTMRRFYGAHCKTECASNNHYFGYGDDYMRKCHKLCDKKYFEFVQVHDRVKAELEKNVANCMETQSADEKKMKACIFDFQKQAFGVLGKALEKLRPKNNLD